MILRVFSKSISVRTRMMLNFARQGKLWWRLVATLKCKLFVKFGFLRRKTNRTSCGCFLIFFIRAGVEQFSSGKANAWRNRERVVLVLTLRGAPNTHHTTAHTTDTTCTPTHNTTSHTERGQRKKEGEREKRKHMFHVFFCM